MLYFPEMGPENSLLFQFSQWDITIFFHSRMEEKLSIYCSVYGPIWILGNGSNRVRKGEERYSFWGGVWGLQRYCKMDTALSDDVSYVDCLIDCFIYMFSVPYICHCSAPKEMADVYT
jgi:hypothetical protein